MSVTIGSNVAGYLVEEEIGRGGMGVVYRAVDLTLERQVALKLIAPELADDPSFRARFLRESRIAASIEHRGILPVYAAGEAEGDLYLTTRLVEGVDLRAVLAKYGPLRAARALALVGQVADALDVAHSRGLVHRDVKPANILVENGDHCYLSDFGLTKQLADDGTTTSDLLAGSLDYLSPEQIRRTLVDGRADQYALACVLYECLSGAPPSRRDTEAQTLWAHLQEDPAPLGPHSSLDPVFARALAKEPSRRYPDCTAFVKAARDALDAGRPRRPASNRVATRTERVAQRRAFPAALATGLLAAVAFSVVAIVSVTGGRSNELARVFTVEPNSVVAIDPATNEVVAEAPVGDRPIQLAAGDGYVWAYNDRSGTLTQIDASRRRAVRTIDLDAAPSQAFPSFAAGFGAAWFIDSTGTLVRVDATSGKVERTAITPGPPGGGVAVGEGSVWVGHRQILRIDPRTTDIVATIDVTGPIVAVGEGAVWAAIVEEPSRLFKIDPTRNAKVGSVPVYAQPWALTTGEGAVWWVTPFSADHRMNGRVWRIDPDTGVVLGGFRAGEGMNGAATGAGSLWVTSARQGTLSRVDPESEEVVARLVLGTPTAVAFEDGLAWVAVT